MNHSRNKRQSERGVILPLLAIILPALMGAIGLSVDTSAMYELDRRLQTAADAAAIAATQEIRLSNADAYESAAKADAALNGFDGNDADVEVEVNRPPVSGKHSGDNAYIEVMVSQPSPLHFMGMFVDEGYTVTARAVSGLEPGDACVTALNGSDRRAVNAVGNVDVTLVGCALYVNSTDATAARTNGRANITAESINVVGDYSGTGFTPLPYTGAVALDDPFADLPMPDASGGCDHVKKKVQGVETLDPGVYCKGLTFNASAEATLNPGTYIIKGGGLTVAGGAVIDGDGVTFYNTEANGKPYDAITINGGSDMALTAPTSGTYKGMLFMQDPGVSSTKTNKFNGNAAVELTGVMYFPSTPVEFSGNFDVVGTNLSLVADTIDFKGTATFSTLNDNYRPPALSYSRLVE